MKMKSPRLHALFTLVLIWIVAIEGAHAAQPLRGSDGAPPEGVSPASRSSSVAGVGWTVRVVSEEELSKLTEKDPNLSPSIARQILAKINKRAPYYIAEDIKAGKPLKVPRDFSAFRKWTPLQRRIPELEDIPKLILIIKDITYLGWYESGRLVGDTYICIGKQQDWTRAGIFGVQEKAEYTFSRSYRNAYGVPAPMPLAMRIYGTVYIHAGDIASGNCSHGCINLPILPAEKLFRWAERGTAVLIVESLEDVETVLEDNRSNCLLYADACNGRRSLANR